MTWSRSPLSICTPCQLRARASAERVCSAYSHAHPITASTSTAGVGVTEEQLERLAGGGKVFGRPKGQVNLE